MPRGFQVPFIAAALIAGCSPQSDAENAHHVRAAPGETTAVERSEVACPAADFDGFLRAISADPRLRTRHTAAVVSVVEWVDLDEPQRGTHVVRVPRGDYRDFSLVYRDGHFLHAEAASANGGVPVEPRIIPTTDGYRVEYVFNMSEGNSWTFVRTRGCWELTGEPEPTLL